MVVLSAFDSTLEDWQSYVERLTLYFTANDIDFPDKQKVILLAHLIYH